MESQIAMHDTLTDERIYGHEAGPAPKRTHTHIYAHRHACTKCSEVTKLHEHLSRRFLMVISGRYYRVVHPFLSPYMMNSLIVKLPVVLFVFACTVVSHYATRLFSGMNTKPVPERTWSLSSRHCHTIAMYMLESKYMWQHK